MIRFDTSRAQKDIAYAFLDDPDFMDLLRKTPQKRAKQEGLKKGAARGLKMGQEEGIEIGKKAGTRKRVVSRIARMQHRTDIGA